MKSYTTIILMLISLGTFGQRIVKSKFDKFDSTREVCTSNVMSATISQFKGFELHVCYFDVQQSKFKTISKPYFTFYFVFNTSGVTSLMEGNSKVQLEFSDGKIIPYEYTGEYQILSREDIGASIYITVPYDEDSLNPIFTQPIKSVRLRTTTETHDFEIKEKKSRLIIKTVEIIKDELAKGNSKM